MNGISSFNFFKIFNMLLTALNKKNVLTFALDVRVVSHWFIFSHIMATL